jgi:hypothetical protein
MAALADATQIKPTPRRPDDLGDGYGRQKRAVIHVGRAVTKSLVMAVDVLDQCARARRSQT